MFRYFNVHMEDSHLFSRCMLCNAAKFLTTTSDWLNLIKSNMKDGDGATTTPSKQQQYKELGPPEYFDDGDNDQDDDYDGFECSGGNQRGVYHYYLTALYDIRPFRQFIALL